MQEEPTSSWCKACYVCSFVQTARCRQIPSARCCSLSHSPHEPVPASCLWHHVVWASLCAEQRLGARRQASAHTEAGAPWCTLCREGLNGRTITPQAASAALQWSPQALKRERVMREGMPVFEQDVQHHVFESVLLLCGHKPAECCACSLSASFPGKIAVLSLQQPWHHCSGVSSLRETTTTRLDEFGLRITVFENIHHHHRR